jgi:hypothetical protein
MGASRFRRVHLFAVVALMAALAALAWLFWRGLAAGVRVPFQAPRVADAVLIAVVAVMLLAVVIFRPERATARALGRTAAIWTLALAAGTAALWTVAFTARDTAAIQGRLVSSAAEAAPILDAAPPPGAGPIYRIPTGVFLQSFEFLTDDNVMVSAYIWQRFGPETPAELRSGVVLPEAENSYAGGSMVEAYRRLEGDTEVVGWYFAGVLRQPFDYAHYPLDRQDIWLRLWPREFDQRIELIPDFDSYADPSAYTSTGIDEEFVYSGWEFVSSGFSYVPRSYDARFGFHEAEFRTAIPELYYNLGVKRDFLPPLIKHLPFALAIAGLVFGAMLLNTNDPELRERFGLATLGVLGANGALLLAVVVEHANIRSTFSSQQIAYIEVLPFTLYGMILLATVNAIALDAPNSPRFFDYRNNVWPLALYWPIFVGVVFVVTYVTFF